MREASGSETDAYPAASTTAAATCSWDKVKSISGRYEGRRQQLVDHSQYDGF